MKRLVLLAIPAFLFLAQATHARDTRAKEVARCIADLRSKNPTVRKDAARQLGRFRDRKAVKPLLALLKDKDYFVRRAVADSLGLIGDEKAIKPMIKAAFARGGDKTSITAGLRHFEEDAVKELIPYLRSKRTGHDAEGMVTKFGILATKFLLPLLEDRNEDVALRAVRILGTVGDNDAVEPIISLVEGSAGKLREVAIFNLGKFKDKRSIPPLMAILDEEDLDDGVRAAAARALGNAHNDEVIGKLKELLSDKSPLVRACAVQGLYATRAKECYDKLREVFEGDRDSEVKLHAAFPLARDKRHGPALEFVVEALKNSKKDHRVQAAKYLREIKDRKTIGPLVEAMKDKDKDVRFFVNSALREITKAQDPAYKGTYKAWKAWWKVNKPKK